MKGDDMTKESQESEVATAIAEFTAEMQKRLEGKFGLDAKQVAQLYMRTLESSGSIKPGSTAVSVSQSGRVTVTGVLAGPVSPIEVHQSDAAGSDAGDADATLDGIREPTSDECTQRKQVGPGYACWYPQMGGYVGKCVVVPSRNGGCFDAYVWHDGEFPFGDRDSTGEARSPVEIHHCMAEQFIEFGTFVSGLPGMKEDGT